MRKPSQAQIAASRRNGARSRGPLSDATRAKVAQNARKHGLTAATIVLEGEDSTRFDDLMNDLIADLAPQTTLEFCYLESLAAALWKQRRAWALERAALNEAEAQADAPDSAGRSLQAWRKLHARTTRDFENILRYGTRLNRELDRAINGFLSLETQREPLENTATNSENTNGKNEPENQPAPVLD